MKKKVLLSLLAITLILSGCGNADTSDVPTDTLKASETQGDIKYATNDKTENLAELTREPYTESSDGYTYGTSLSDEVNPSELNQSALKIVDKAETITDYTGQTNNLPEDKAQEILQEYDPQMYANESSIIHRYGDVNSVEQVAETVENNDLESLANLTGEIPTEKLFTIENGEQLKQDVCDKEGHTLRINYLTGKLECERINEYYIDCEICGQLLFNGYVVGPRHEKEETVLQEGSCSEYRIVATTCKVCGVELDRYTEYTDDHTWETTKENIWNPHTETFEEKEITWCRYCNTIKEEGEQDEN